MKQQRRIRVTVVQPALAKYRIPVFRELSLRQDLDVRLVYGTMKALPNVEPDGFTAIPCRRLDLRLGGMSAVIQPAQWHFCSPRMSDVVVLQWTPRSLSLIPALIRAGRKGVATVLWGHGYSKHENPWRRYFREVAARFSTALLFYEPLTREEFIREGWDSQTLFVALNSLDNTEIDAARCWWQEHPQALAEFRHRNKLDDGPVVLFVSRLQAENRVDLLIRATAKLTQVCPGLKTVIIGNGSAERERLQSLAAELGVSGNIIFHDGIYNELELAPWFLLADAFCYPSNIGLSLMHAFWYGVPVVTSDNRAVQNPEFVALKNDVNGITYFHGNINSLVDALRTIIQNPKRRAKLSIAARETVENSFTIPKMVDGFEAAIKYAYRSVSRTAHSRRCS